MQKTSELGRNQRKLGHIYTQRRDKGSGTGYGLDCFPTGGQREGRPMLVVGHSTLPAHLFTLVPHIGHSKAHVAKRVYVMTLKFGVHLFDCQSAFEAEVVVKYLVYKTDNVNIVISRNTLHNECNGLFVNINRDQTLSICALFQYYVANRRHKYCHEEG